MPERYVAARCGNIKDEANGISMHRIPFFGTTCPQRLRRRKKWIDFGSFCAGAEEDVDAWKDLVLVLDALIWRGFHKADEFRFKLKT